MDDDASVREALRALLRSAGFRVEAFGSAEEFLRPRQAVELACLLLDVRMPGMSGLELQERLIDSGSAIPIVFMTAHADGEVCAQALAAGAVQVLQKPFGDDDLLKAVGRAIETGRS